jgi:hypothetical protein
MSTKNYEEIADLIEDRAPTITTSELAERRARALAGNVVEFPEHRTRQAKRIVVVTAAAAAVAVIVAGSLQLSGRQGVAGHAGPQAVQSAKPIHPHASVHAIRLTAAMVRHIARASHLALASAGHVFVHYRDVQAPYSDTQGSLDITFSGKNFNSISNQPGTKPFIERVVDGKIFAFGAPPPGQPLQWYLSTTQTSSGGVPVPDPRTLLNGLQPTAGFEVIGHEVIDGVPVEHLRATSLTGLKSQLLSLDTADQPLSGLDVWVDGQGVIRAMELHCKGVSQPSKVIETNTISIKFLDIGKPETIVAPAHYGTDTTEG